MDNSRRAMYLNANGELVIENPDKTQEVLAELKPHVEHCIAWRSDGTVYLDGVLVRERDEVS